MIISIVISFGLGFDNNVHSFNYQTNELKNYHRKPVLTVHLYTDGHLQPVFHQPPTRADVSKFRLLSGLQDISPEFMKICQNFCDLVIYKWSVKRSSLGEFASNFHFHICHEWWMFGQEIWEQVIFHISEIELKIITYLTTESLHHHYFFYLFGIDTVQN